MCSEVKSVFLRGKPTALSNFLGAFPTYTQLPAIDQVNVLTGDSAYTVDDGSYWRATKPSSPPGAAAVWMYIDTLRGSPGPQGVAGVGSPGSQGQIGPQGPRGAPGSQGPPGKNSFSYLSHLFTVPAVNAAPLATNVTDTSWMTPGLLLYIPNAGTFTVVGSPVDAYNVNLVNSGDPNNAASGTQINAGTVVSPATQRGPIGPAGGQGPQGPPGPQGVSGASAYTTLVQAFTIPANQGVAFVLNAVSFSVGLIVYVASSASNGVYCSVTAVNTTNNTLTLQNKNYPGGDPVGTVAPVGATISGTGPQGPQGIQGPVGPVGPQGAIGLAPTGTIVMYGAPTPPGGWLNCDGTPYGRTQYAALFSVISTTYGVGDGSSTFNVPNFQGVFPLGVSPTYPLASVGGEATHALTVAELAAHNHTISATESAHTHGMDHFHNIGAGQFSHTHTDAGHFHTYVNPLGPVAGAVGAAAYVVSGQANTSTAQANIQAATLGAGNTVYASQTNGAWTNTGATAATITASAANAGSGTPHNNMPPYVTVNYIIKT